jgi:hypothetical protein
MNIQSVTSAYGAQPVLTAARGGKKTAAPEQTAAAQNEQVVLSDDSISFQKVKEALKQIPEVRIPMVEEIKVKVKFNGYPVESNLYKAVEKLIENGVIS